MLIAMQEHVEEERVLLVVQREREHLKQLGVLDAEPGQGLRVRYARGRVVCVGEVKQGQSIRIVQRLVCAVVDEHEEHVTALPGEQARSAVHQGRIVHVGACGRRVVCGQAGQK